MKLLGAYEDGYIEFFYEDVVRYSLDSTDLLKGHYDWKYDEFRLSDEGNVIHEIEWAGLSQTARWIIEAKNLIYSWHKRR